MTIEERFSVVAEREWAACFAGQRSFPKFSELLALALAEQLMDKCGFGQPA